MNEIRFNQPEHPKPVPPSIVNDRPENSIKNKKTRGVIMSTLLLIVKIIFIFFLLYAALFGYRYFMKDNSNDTTYHAVFLTNDQVYFGKMLENNKNEIVLNNVFYLQTVGTDLSPGAESLDGSKFTLVKLGQELHGPTEMMYINKDQILFYEELRPDSEVVKTIENFKSR